MEKRMIREKSCGALVYRKKQDKVELLLIKHRNGGHWSFPKGHVESGENEYQTALREIKEETGLDVNLRDGFRQSVEYFPKPHVKKQVVYFLGYPGGDDTVKRQEEEISEYQWCLLDDADGMVTFRNDKNLINEAKRFLAKDREH
ncbi:bis(5'-nucleosyl)-tetraphosphatase [Anaerotruncus massiliensis (ex Togo et al. 2019)]|jgi:hypothetical protein|nr:NUDIX domain-containing protein [Anaerotruncus massiliensis (ex Togo et al. 2019)]GKH48562.1 diadenosine 5'5'''-P1,P4-tetraphosphate pyrophosphohydrolase [Oscillospiraceae bacterium]